MSSPDSLWNLLCEDLGYAAKPKKKTRKSRSTVKKGNPAATIAPPSSHIDSDEEPRTPPKPTTPPRSNAVHRPPQMRSDQPSPRLPTLSQLHWTEVERSVPTHAQQPDVTKRATENSKRRPKVPTTTASCRKNRFLNPPTQQEEAEMWKTGLRGYKPKREWVPSTGKSITPFIRQEKKLQERTRKPLEGKPSVSTSRATVNTTAKPRAPKHSSSPPASNIPLSSEAQPRQKPVAKQHGPRQPAKFSSQQTAPPPSNAPANKGTSKEDATPQLVKWLGTWLRRHERETPEVKQPTQRNPKPPRRKKPNPVQQPSKPTPTLNQSPGPDAQQVAAAAAEVQLPQGTEQQEEPRALTRNVRQYAMLKRSFRALHSVGSFNAAKTSAFKTLPTVDDLKLINLPATAGSLALWYTGFDRPLTLPDTLGEGTIDSVLTEFLDSFSKWREEQLIRLRDLPVRRLRAARVVFLKLREKHRRDVTGFLQRYRNVLKDHAVVSHELDKQHAAENSVPQVSPEQLSPTRLSSVLQKCTTVTPTSRVQEGTGRPTVPVRRQHQILLTTVGLGCRATTSITNLPRRRIEKSPTEYHEVLLQTLGNKTLAKALFVAWRHFVAQRKAQRACADNSRVRTLVAAQQCWVELRASHVWTQVQCYRAQVYAAKSCIVRARGLVETWRQRADDRWRVQLRKSIAATAGKLFTVHHLFRRIACFSFNEKGWRSYMSAAASFHSHKTFMRVMFAWKQAHLKSKALKQRIGDSLQMKSTASSRNATSSSLPLTQPSSQRFREIRTAAVAAIVEGRRHVKRALYWSTKPVAAVPSQQGGGVAAVLDISLPLASAISTEIQRSGKALYRLASPATTALDRSEGSSSHASLRGYLSLLVKARPLAARVHRPNPLLTELTMLWIPASVPRSHDLLPLSSPAAAPAEVDVDTGPSFNVDHRRIHRHCGTSLRQDLGRRKVATALPPLGSLLNTTQCGQLDSQNKVENLIFQDVTLLQNARADAIDGLLEHSNASSSGTLKQAAIAYHRTRLLRKVMFYWHRVASLNAIVRRRAAWRSYRVKSNFFVAWREEIHHWRQMVAVSNHSWKRQFCRRMLLTWRRNAVQEHALYGALLTKFRTLTLGRRAFIAWLRAIKAKRQQRRTLHSGYEWRILYTGKRALRQWKAKITLALAQKRAKQRLWPRLLRREGRLPFLAWASNARRNRLLRRVLQAAAARWHQRIHAWEDPSYRFEVLSNLLLGWKAVIAAKKEQATVAAALETARLYHSTSLMVKVFAAWSGKARQRRRHADILRTARMKKLQTLFRSWCEATCIAKSRRTWFQQQRLTHQLRFYFDRLRHCAKAQRLLRLVEKQRIFDAWRQQMLQRTREFPALHWRQRTKKQCFHALFVYMHRQKLRQAAESYWKSRALGRAFRCLHRNAGKNVALRELFRLRRAKLLIACFREWRRQSVLRTRMHQRSSHSSAAPSTVASFRIQGVEVSSLAPHVRVYDVHEPMQQAKGKEQNPSFIKRLPLREIGRLRQTFHAWSHDAAKRRYCPVTSPTATSRGSGPAPIPRVAAGSQPSAVDLSNIPVWKKR